MKRYFCKECSGILPKRKIVCDKCGYENPELIPMLRERIKRQIFIRRITRIAAVAALILILNASLLFPWQWGARGNRKVILDYVAERYPNAKIISQKYNSARFFKWNNYRDGIVFELEGIEFNIIAEGGNILADGYPRARAEDQLKRMIYADFLTIRKINADCAIDFFSGNEPTDNIAAFDGIVFINLQVDSQYVELRKIDWLFDFYLFLRDKINPLKYNVSIFFCDEDVPNTKKQCIVFSSQSEYFSKSDFYASFS